MTIDVKEMRAKVMGLADADGDITRLEVLAILDAHEARGVELEKERARRQREDVAHMRVVADMDEEHRDTLKVAIEGGAAGLEQSIKVLLLEARVAELEAAVERQLQIQREFLDAIDKYRSRVSALEAQLLEKCRDLDDYRAKWETEAVKAMEAEARVSALEGQLALQTISTDEAEARATMQRERAEKAEAEVARLQRPSTAPPETFRDPELSTNLARARTEEGSNE